MSRRQCLIGLLVAALLLCLAGEVMASLSVAQVGNNSFEIRTARNSVSTGDGKWYTFVKVTPQGLEFIKDRPGGSKISKLERALKSSEFSDYLFQMQWEPELIQQIILLLREFNQVDKDLMFKISKKVNKQEFADALFVIDIGDGYLDDLDLLQDVSAEILNGALPLLTAKGQVVTIDSLLQTGKVSQEAIAESLQSAYDLGYIATFKVLFLHASDSAISQALSCVGETGKEKALGPRGKLLVLQFILGQGCLKNPSLDKKVVSDFFDKIFPFLAAKGQVVMIESLLQTGKVSQETIAKSLRLAYQHGYVSVFKALFLYASDEVANKVLSYATLIYMPWYSFSTEVQISMLKLMLETGRLKQEEVDNALTSFGFHCQRADISLKKLDLLVSNSTKTAIRIFSGKIFGQARSGNYGGEGFWKGVEMMTQTGQVSQEEIDDSFEPLVRNKMSQDLLDFFLNNATNRADALPALAGAGRADAVEKILEEDSVPQEVTDKAFLAAVNSSSEPSVSLLLSGATSKAINEGFKIATANLDWPIRDILKETGKVSQRTLNQAKGVVCQQLKELLDVPDIHLYGNCYDSYSKDLASLFLHNSQIVYCADDIEVVSSIINLASRHAGSIIAASRILAQNSNDDLLKRFHEFGDEIKIHVSRYGTSHYKEIGTGWGWLYRRYLNSGGNMRVINGLRVLLGVISKTAPRIIQDWKMERPEEEN